MNEPIKKFVPGTLDFYATPGFTRSMTDENSWPAGITPENYPEFISKSSEHITRKGKDMEGYFEEEPDPDKLIYEVYEAETLGHINLALTVIKAGKVGREFHMTKGHFHEDGKAGEVYVCLKGKGMIIMQTRDGQTDEISLNPGGIAYVPPGWAHRTVNIGNEDFIMVAIYPETSGHDYDSIMEKGFIKRVIEQQGQVQVI